MALAVSAERGKAVLKELADRHPEFVKNNRVYYEIQRKRAYGATKVTPTLTDRPDLLKELEDRGVVMVEDYIPRADAEAMLAAAEGTLERARRGELPEYTFTNQPEILLRVANADQVVPETRPFFDDPTIRNVFRARLSPDVSSYRHELDYRYGLAEAGIRQADLYHFDNWRPIFKAFLYLTEVSEAQSPFVYVPGTHTQAEWKRRHEIAYDVYGPTGPFGHFLPQEMRALRAEYGWEDLICTGGPGTLILADFRGLHRGTPLRAGRRVLLNNTFDLMNMELADG